MTIILVCLSLTLATAAQQRDAPKPKPATASLSGRVTALDTGKPIRRAQVTISAPELSPNRAVSTDADGRWSFVTLPAGRYSISVAKPGYLSLTYGQRRPHETGTPVTVSEGQTVAKLDVALPRAAAISGNVVDEFGEPMARVRVAAQRFGYVRGQRRLTATGDAATTDDLGAFRIYGLPPGDYYVSASPPSGSFAQLSDDRSGYTRTFFPSALSEALATRLTLAVGQTVADLVIALPPARLARISGTAVDSTGRAARWGMGNLRPQGARWGDSGWTFMFQDGRWTATGVPAGTYQLFLQTMEDPQRLAQTGSTIGMRVEFAEQDLTVTGENIEGVTVVTAPAGTATGRVLFEGGMTFERMKDHAYLRALDADGIAPAGGGPVLPGGTFQLTGLSGHRLFRVEAPPQTEWIMKSVTLNGADITDTPILTPLGAQLSGLEVTITTTSAELSGSVPTAKGAATADYTVVLFAADTARRGPYSRFTKTIRTDTNGRFTLGNLPAGEYFAAAVEYIEPGQELDPEFLERLVPSSTSVRLAEGEKKAVTLRPPR